MTYKEYLAKLASKRTDETPAEKEHRAKLRAESEAVRRVMVADPRYCKPT